MQDPGALLRAPAGNGFPEAAATCWPTFSAIIGSLDIVFGEIDR